MGLLQADWEQEEENESMSVSQVMKIKDGFTPTLKALWKKISERVQVAFGIILRGT